METQFTDSLGLPSHVPSLNNVRAEHASDGIQFNDDTATKTSPQIDRDLMCPICMQVMTDAFLTSCGHSFCYTCITKHLNNRRNCPCCGHFLTQEQLFPNFLLNKLLKKAAANQLVSNASPTEHLRFALQQGAEVSIKELDSLLALIVEKKRKSEQEEAEANMEILLDFLHRSRQKKQEELDELKRDLQFLKDDIQSVETRQKDLFQLKERASQRLRMLLDSSQASLDPLSGQKHEFSSRFISRSGQAGATTMNVSKLGKGKHPLLKIKEENPLVTEFATNDASEISSAINASTIAKKRRVFAQFEDLQECYLQRRRKMASLMNSEIAQNSCEKPSNSKKTEGLKEEMKSGLTDFQNILTAFTKFSRLKVIAELRHGDLFHSSNIVSSIEFDRDDEVFATAGVSRRIKVFEYASVVNELANVHCPVVEMSTRSKLSCLSWNKYIKAYLASSDYEGIVTVWDVNTCQALMEYEEHEKRAWSVDFSKTEPTKLVSGSDDGKVKIWCTRQEKSVINIDMKANICCVKFNPGSSNFVAVGSADHHIHYYDVRHTLFPLHVFSGHRKAVSYVKFVSPTELASASTDSTLRLWDVKENCAIRTLRGHTNEKNFVGLSVSDDYIACGSETNEVYVYYKEMSKPAAIHKFGSPDPVTGEESDDDSAHFISAVCWKSDNSPTMLVANSQGAIKVLELAP